MLNNIISDTVSSFIGMLQMKQGAKLALTGGNLMAEQVLSSIDMFNSTANYNNKLMDLSVSRELNDLNSQTIRFISSQQATAVASGFEAGSKSFLSLYNESLRQAETNTNRIINDNIQRKAINIYRARLSSIEARNTATAIAIQTKAQQFSSTSAILNAGTGFGRLFGQKLIPNVKTLLELQNGNY